MSEPREVACLLGEGDRAGVDERLVALRVHTADFGEDAQSLLRLVDEAGADLLEVVARVVSCGVLC